MGLVLSLTALGEVLLHPKFVDFLTLGARQRMVGRERELEFRAVMRALLSAAQETLNELQAAERVPPDVTHRVLELVLEQLEETLTFDLALILICKGEHLELMTAGGRLPPPPNLRIPLDEEVPLTWAIQNRSHVVVPDAEARKCLLARVLKEELRSYVIVPLLLSNDNCAGVLTVARREPHAYSPSDVLWVRAFGNYAAIALHYGFLAARTRTALDEAAFLYEAARTLPTRLKVTEILQELLNLTRRWFEPDAVSVARVELDGGIVFEVASGGAAEHIVGQRMASGEGIVGWVAHQGRATWVPDVYSDNRFYRQMDQELDFVTRSIYAAPIKVNDRTLAVVEMVNPLPDMEMEGVRRVMSALTSLAASAIHNAELYELVTQTEENYQRLFEHNVDPVVILDAQGYVMNLNQAARRLLDYEEQEKCEYYLPRLQMTPEQFEEHKQELRSGGEVVWEAPFNCAPAHDCHLEIHLIHFGPYNGHDVYLWIAHDITGRVELEEMRRNLSHMIVHDLRNPLHIIMNSLDLLHTATVKGDEELPLETLLHIAQRSTERMDNLITEILDTSKLQKDRRPLSVEHVDVRQVVEEATKFVDTLVTARRQSLSVDLPEDLPHLKADPGLLQRVVLNLLDNAIKFTPTEGAVTVKVEFREGAFWFSVHDTGPGIPPQEQETVFELYKRGRNAHHVRGAGLGLAFCRLAVEAHGGRIWVESEPGEGATFYFTLPQAPTVNHSETKEGP
jgi:PAS domain S-box-containing protein